MPPGGGRRRPPGCRRFGTVILIPSSPAPIPILVTSFSHTAQQGGGAQPLLPLPRPPDRMDKSFTPLYKKTVLYAADRPACPKALLMPGRARKKAVCARSSLCRRRASACPRRLRSQIAGQRHAPAGDGCKKHALLFGKARQRRSGKRAYASMTCRRPPKDSA